MLKKFLPTDILWPVIEVFFAIITNASAHWSISVSFFSVAFSLYILMVSGEYRWPHSVSSKPGRTALIRNFLPCVWAAHLMKWSCAALVTEYAMELPPIAWPWVRSQLHVLCGQKSNLPQRKKLWWRHRPLETVWAWTFAKEGVWYAYQDLRWRLAKPLWGETTVPFPCKGEAHKKESEVLTLTLTAQHWSAVSKGTYEMERVNELCPIPLPSKHPNLQTLKTLSNPTSSETKRIDDTCIYVQHCWLQCQVLQTLWLSHECNTCSQREYRNPET